MFKFLFGEKRRSPFLTGSRAYGTYSTDSSDTDMVMKMTEKEFERFCYSAGVDPEHQSGNKYKGYGNPKFRPIRIGHLNIIPVSTDEAYDLWWKATQSAIRIQPKTKEETIRIFDLVFEGKKRH